MQDRVDRLPVCECVVNKTNVATCCRRVEFEIGDWRWIKSDGKLLRDRK